MDGLVGANEEDVFALPGGTPDGLMQMIQQANNAAIEARRNQRTPKKRKGRGPARTKLRLHYYLLPEHASEAPRLSSTRDQTIVEMHHQCGFGYPHAQKRQESCNMGLTPAEFNSFLRSLYPNQSAAASFHLYTADRRKELVKVEGGQDTLYGYSGVVFIKVSAATGVEGRPMPIQEATTTEGETYDDSQMQLPFGRSGAFHEEIMSSSDGRQHELGSERTAVPRVPQTAPTDMVTTRVEPRQQPTPEASITDQPGDDPNMLLPTNSSVSFDDEANRNLVAQQDRDFSLSLELDRERERNRREARVRLALSRLERRQNRERVRNRNEEESERLLAALEDEPEEGILIQFRLPDRTLRRKVPFDASCSLLYSFIRGSYGVQHQYQIFWQNTTLPENDTEIGERGVNGNCVMNVHVNDMEEDKDSDEDGESVVSEIEEQSAQTTSPSYNIATFDDLKERAGEIKSSFTDIRVVKVKREHIVTDLTDAYTNNKDLIFSDVIMEIEGEPALDVDGVKREVFSLFFKTLAGMYFVGSKEMIPQLDPRILFTGFYETVGRIISHCFVLTGFFPISICRAAVHMMLTGKASTKCIMASFLNHIVERERSVVEKVMAGQQLNSCDYLSFLSVLSFHGCLSSPKAEDRLSIVENVAASSLLCKPLFCYGRIFAGMNAYPLLWLGVTGEVVDELYSRLQPSAESVVEAIHYSFTDVEEEVTLRTLLDIRSAEERVKTYLERFVESRSKNELADLLFFWTGSDLNIVPQLHVCFNATEGLSQRPIASTCAAQLILSRMYVSYEEFETQFVQYLASDEAKHFDTD